MIPAAFDYQRPASVDEALDAIVGGGEPRCIAGGQSLLPLLKMRLASAGTLVDIGRLRAPGIRPAAGRRPRDRGARRPTPRSWSRTRCDRHRGDLRHRRCPGPQPRDRRRRDRPRRSGGDLPALGLALDYSVVLRSKRGERVVPLDGFFQGAFQTAIAAGRAARRHPARAVAGRARSVVSQPQPAGLRVLDRRRRGDRCQDGWRREPCPGGITGVGEVAYRAKAVESAVAGSDGSAAAIAAAAAHATDGVTGPATSTRTARIGQRWPYLHASRARGCDGPLRLRAGRP